MTLLALSFGILIAIVAAAVKGIAYRGAYFALTIAALALGAFVGWLIPPSPTIETDDISLQVGTEMMFNHGPSVAASCFLIAVGGLVGGCAFRSQNQPKGGA